MLAIVSKYAKGKDAQKHIRQLNGDMARLRLALLFTAPLFPEEKGTRFKIEAMGIIKRGFLPVLSECHDPSYFGFPAAEMSRRRADLRETKPVFDHFCGVGMLAPPSVRRRKNEPEHASSSHVSQVRQRRHADVRLLQKPPRHDVPAVHQQARQGHADEDAVRLDILGTRAQALPRDGGPLRVCVGRGLREETQRLQVVLLPRDDEERRD